MSDPYSGTLHFYHSLLKISLSQEFCPLWECLFSYRYPSFNFSVKFGISCNNIAQIAEFVHKLITIILSFRPVCLLTTVSFPLLFFNAFLFLFYQYFHSMFLQTLFSVGLFVIFCSVDLLAIVAWSFLIIKPQCFDQSSSSLFPIT